MTERLFHGVKVIDAATFVAAPACGVILADFGADVIKLEPPEGDPYRRAAPPLWQLASRNKRGLVLDLRSADGLAALHRILDDTDVFITNLPLGARERMKVSYAHLSAGRPRLIYASFTAYGEIGPDVDKPGFDSTSYWARTGILDEARPNDEAEPAWPVPGIGDQPAGVGLFAAIAGALYRRERTGLGGMVSSSLLANGLWANGLPVQAALGGARRLPRAPRLARPNALVNNYRCADGGWISLMIMNEEKLFPALLDALGLGPLRGDPRFLTRETRATHAAPLIVELDAAFATRGVTHWRETLDRAGVTFDVMLTVEQIGQDQQILASGALAPLAHNPDALTVSSPFELADAPKTPAGPAPTLGEHSDDILAEAGLSPDEIASLRKSGALGATPTSA
ncbi:MAG: CoA transferase [Hyphomonadaceae bacterium]|nr:CoA transferase [Hyphomonadaceae bacterium]